MTDSRNTTHCRVWAKTLENTTHSSGWYYWSVLRSLLGVVTESLPIVAFIAALVRVRRQWTLNVIQKTAFDAGLALQKRMIIALGVLAAISAAVDIAAQSFGPQTIVYIFKPLTMVFIISIAVIRGSGSSGYRSLVLAALCCSLAGDVFLMLPSDQFVPGLLSFLMAHLFYIAAFRTRPSGVPSALCGLACVAYGTLMLWLLFPHLGAMKLPVSIYLVVILVMVWQALNRWVTTRGAGAGLAAIGAVLFASSDSMIAVDRFYGKVHLAELFILAPYFTAQCLIALSIRRPLINTPLQRGDLPNADVRTVSTVSPRPRGGKTV